MLNSLIHSKRVIVSIVLVTAALIGAYKSYGASCCGSGASGMASLITGDYKYQIQYNSQITTTVALTGDATDPSRYFAVSEPLAENRLTHTLALATMLDPSWQIYTSLPIYQQSGFSGFGSLSTGFAYEFLSEGWLGLWQPRGLVFASIGWPTTTNNPGMNSANDSDFVSIQFGLLATKNFGSTDVTFSTAITQKLLRKLNNRQSEDYNPALAAHVSASHSLEARGPWRIGVTVGPNYEGPALETTTNPRPAQLHWDLWLQLSYMASENTSLTLAYGDQTILGPSFNSTLQRGLLATIQYGLF